ncbi:MAG: hypothetical protein EAZ92_03915 [Candidatus Kapaibacterium sp.]|nr:MAG: hypothetical protein EAZ92_03915 [Candidatus Kapabacteria bacterium]
MAQPAPEAQWQTGNRIMVRGGVALPLFGYGALPITIADFTPQEGRTPVGAAMLGGTFGIGTMYRLHPSVAVIGGIDVNYNPYNTVEAEKNLRTSIGAINLLGLNVNLLSSALASILQSSAAFSAEPHINGTALAGLRYDVQIVPAVLSAYVSGELGAMFGVFPKTQSKVNITIPLFNINTDIINSINQTSGFGFAWAVGGGLLVSERVNIGVRYLAASPTYTSQIANTVETRGGATGTINIPIPGIGRLSSQDIIASILGAFPAREAPFTLPTTMLQCTISYAF